LRVNSNGKGNRARLPSVYFKTVSAEQLKPLKRPWSPNLELMVLPAPIRESESVFDAQSLTRNGHEISLLRRGL
jgi:hypothetical protein